MRTIIVVAFAVVAGIGVGAFAAFHFGGRLVGKSDVTGEVAEAALIVKALEHLRAEDIVAANELLEARLDGAVINMSVVDHSGFGAETNAKVKGVLHKVRDYRQRFPRKSAQPNVDAAVASALSKP
jgi:hypothetical protein